MAAIFVMKERSAASNSSASLPSKRSMFKVAFPCAFQYLRGLAKMQLANAVMAARPCHGCQCMADRGREAKRERKSERMKQKLVGFNVIQEIRRIQVTSYNSILGMILVLYSAPIYAPLPSQLYENDTISFLAFILTF